MSVQVLEIKTDVRRVLEECLQRSDELDGVIVLGIKKCCGGQILETSTMSAMEKTYLHSFLGWFLAKHFD